MLFLNPWLLGGMAAIAGPIILHLLMKRKVVPMEWAAMRFLLAVVDKNEKKLRVEDLLLLALRCLLLILLALALARPAFRAAGMALGGGPRTVVIALDNSRSMGLTDGGASRFENGKKAAGQLLDSLPAGSTVSLLLFSDVVRPLIEEPATDLNLARKLIGDAELTDRASNVHPALKEALDILKRHTETQGEVFMITDAQATGWSELAAMRSEVTAAAAAHVAIVVPGPGQQPNLGVSRLAMRSPMMPVGMATRFSIEATNYGWDEARNVTLGLSIDGGPPSDETVISSIPAGESRWVSLFGKAKTAGYHEVTAQLPADHLAADDRRTMVVRAVDDVRVLLIAGNMGATPQDGDALYLDAALAPVGPEESDRYFIKPHTVDAADLSEVKLADYDVVALVDVPRLDAQTVGELEKFVSGGGGLMIFPGDKMDPDFYNQKLGKDLGLLPATMGTPWGDTEGHKQFRSLQGPPYTHPVVSIWQDPAAGTLTTGRFYKGVPLEPLAPANKEAGRAVTVVTYADGTPAIVERTWGSGRVIEFSSTANAAWNDLPAHPAYVALMQRALGRLVTRRDEALNIRVGAPFVYPAKPDWLYKEMTVTRPGGAPGSGEKSKVGLIDGAPLLRHEDTDHAGAYAVAIDTQPATGLSFAAQADPEESRLDAIPDSVLKTLGTGTQVIHWGPDTNMRQALGLAGNGREFWTIFAWSALAVACGEMLLAGRFSAAK